MVENEELEETNKEEKSTPKVSRKLKLFRFYNNPGLKELGREVIKVENLYCFFIWQESKELD